MWQYIKSFFLILLAPFVPIFRIIPALATMIGLAFASGDLIDSFVETLNGLSSYVASAPATSLVAQVNRITPLSEAFAMLASLLALSATAMMIRFIMKFMPGGH